MSVIQPPTSLDVHPDSRNNFTYDNSAYSNSNTNSNTNSNINSNINSNNASSGYSNNTYYNLPAVDNGNNTERVTPFDGVSQKNSLKPDNGTNEYMDGARDGAIPPPTLMAANGRQSSPQGLGVGTGEGPGGGGARERDKSAPQLPQTPSDSNDDDEDDADSTMHGSSYRMLPLLIGCTIPVSILMNVASVTTPWAAHVAYDASTGHWVHTSDLSTPAWLRVMASLTLGMSVICNLCVLLRFLERHTYTNVVLSIVTVVIQDAIGIATTIAFCIVYPVHDGYNYVEGFWTMIASHAFALSATLFMLLDFYRTPYFRLRGSGVTPKQRILIAEAMFLCFYLAIGALIFIYLEQWTYLEALFFAMVTVTTIGFGNQVPTNSGGQVFNVFYASGGIILLTMVVNGIRYVILESLHRRFAILAKRRKTERHARRRERKEKLKMEGAYSNGDHPSRLIYNSEATENKPGEGTAGQGVHPSLRDGLDTDPVNITRTGNAPNSSSNSGAMGMGSKTYRSTEHRPWWRRILPFQKTAPSLMDFQGTVHEEREAERRRAYDETMGQYRSDLRYYGVLFIIFWFVGAVIFEFLESWGFGISFYFVFVAFSTLGYGAIYPTTRAGQAIFVAYCLIGIVMVSSMGSLCTDVLSKMLRKSVVDTEIQRLDRLEALDDANELFAEDMDVEDKKSHAPEGEDLSHSARVKVLDNYIEDEPVDPQRTPEDDDVQGSIRNLLKVSKDFNNLLQKVLGHPEYDASQASQPGFEPSRTLRPISSATPGDREGLSNTMPVATIHLDTLNQYANKLKALTGTCEETLQRLASWDASEKKLRKQRIYARLRQKRLLQERRRQLQNGGVPVTEDDVEKEDELDELDNLDDDGDDEEKQDAELDRRRRRLIAKFLGKNRGDNHRNGHHNHQEGGSVGVPAASGSLKP